MNDNNKIPYLGLIVCFCYFITTIGLVLTSTTVFLVLMELVTILSAPVLLVLLMTVPAEGKSHKEMAKKISIIFMASCMVLTSAAHFMNLAFIMPMMSSGINIPLYLQIGQWPSALMAIDYLGWGYFMGAAFLASSVAVARQNSLLKYTLFVCGILCLLGLVGTVTIHANFWYIAPIGYGIGSTIVCIELIVLNNSQVK